MSDHSYRWEQYMAKPDFTGTWKFAPGKSSLQIRPPDSTVFVIVHNEPRFQLKRTHVFGGNSDTFSIDLTTDGRVVELNRAGLVIHASLHWEGETLVFDSTLNREGTQGTNIVRYRLADQNQVFLADERFQSPELTYENKWVFDRQKS
jgi:hypothetical protein